MREREFLSRISFFVSGKALTLKFYFSTVFLSFICCESTSPEVPTTETEAGVNSQHERQKPGENLPKTARRCSPFSLPVSQFKDFFVVPRQTFEQQKQVVAACSRGDFK